MAQHKPGRRRWYAKAAVALLAALLLAGCGRCARQLHEAIQDADEPLAHVFMGTVVETTWTSSRVEVEEVWFGPDLAPEVWLRGGGLVPQAPLGVGERRVIGVPEGRRLTTNSCHMDGVLTGNIKEVKPEPEQIRAPVVGGVTGDPPPSTWIDGTRPYALGVLGAFIGIAVAIVVRSRRGRR